MNLSNPSSSGNVSYPAITGTSDNAAENTNNSSVVNSQTQGSGNNSTSPNTGATDNPNLRSTRQTRSFANPYFQFLPSEDRLNAEELREARQREIERIISGRVDDAFGLYHIGT